MLTSAADAGYARFQSRLIPTVAQSAFIGVRTPELRKMAKTMAKHPEIDTFIHHLPHEKFDELQLHAFIVSEIKDFDRCVTEVERLLPYIDNWATCDQLSPAIFKKNHDRLLPYIDRWIGNDHEYTVRFGIGMLMSHFLDQDFKPEHINQVVNVSRDEFYVKMMVAWYIATALAKQWEATIGVIRKRMLTPWIHRKAIQKAVESRRLSDEQKVYLRSLR